MDKPPSNDLPLLAGRSKTLNDEVDESPAGGLRTSSRALPEDFLL